MATFPVLLRRWALSRIVECGDVRPDPVGRCAQIPTGDGKDILSRPGLRTRDEPGSRISGPRGSSQGNQPCEHVGHHGDTDHRRNARLLIASGVRVQSQMTPLSFGRRLPSFLPGSTFRAQPCRAARDPSSSASRWRCTRIPTDRCSGPPVPFAPALAAAAP